MASCSKTFSGQRVNVCVTEAEMTNVRSEANILPLFERRLADLLLQKIVSLVKNKPLNAKWKQYIDLHLDGSVHLKKLPTQEYHFKNLLLRHGEDESTKKNVRKHMKIGPGWDCYGVIPIPDDQHIRKTKALRTKLKVI